MCAAGFGTYRRPLGESRLFIARRLERITTDICRYRSSAGRRHHRLAWVIRRLGDNRPKCFTSEWPTSRPESVDATSVACGFLLTVFLDLRYALGWDHRQRWQPFQHPIPCPCVHARSGGTLRSTMRSHAESHGLFGLHSSWAMMA